MEGEASSEEDAQVAEAVAAYLEQDAVDTGLILLAMGFPVSRHTRTIPYDQIRLDTYEVMRCACTSTRKSLHTWNACNLLCVCVCVRAWCCEELPKEGCYVFALNVRAVG